MSDPLELRIRTLREASLDGGKCVWYVMSRDQRVRANHALVAAQKRALALGLPLAVLFCLQPATGLRRREHYEWMLTGLHEVEAHLKTMHIPFLLLIGDPLERLKGAAHHLQPAAVYFDMSPLRGPRRLHETFAADTTAAVYEVDTHNVVPLWVASDKQEVGARTLRPKIQRLLPQFLAAPAPLVVHPHNWPGTVQSLDTLQPLIQPLLDALPVSGQKFAMKSGEAAAQAALQDFLEHRLEGYAERRNDPSLSATSGLSPYLHFGQLSALQVALELPQTEDAATLIEEMIVRKELSDNYCFYNGNYDNLLGAPMWAQKSLNAHRADPRDFLYSRDELEAAATHDPAWNAAQTQLMRTGFMHGYMRMYWAKKVLEWSESPEHAIEHLIYLNDVYSLDGGDPNGYTGILWSVGGVHDRPWGERAIFGVIRYMNYAGLKRKFAIEVYETQNS